MAVHASHAALPYPIRGARFSLLVPYLTSDGFPAIPGSADTEISKDSSLAIDCVEEISLTSGMDGMALMTLTGDEMTCAAAGLNAKSSNGGSLATIYPRVLAVVASGTLAAGTSSGGTLGTVLTYDIAGCFIRTTGGTGGGGGDGNLNNQARKVTSYNPVNGQFTVTPNWEVAVDVSTTYDILLPEGLTRGMLLNIAQTGDSFAHISPAGSTVGKRVMDNLDAAVTTRLPTSTYVAPNNSGITSAAASAAAAATSAAAALTRTVAIQAKTDLLPFSGSSLQVEIIRVNGRLITGLGTSADPFRPVG